ncbi:hypothetical protein AB0B78_32575 [Streptomyces sp. NPDC040724]|uniref:hypothetical protein n=1 Tax=Streptomyces sp. NPDC040724 TaxID=3155612 RepID=UPI0033C99653
MPGAGPSTPDGCSFRSPSWTTWLRYCAETSLPLAAVTTGTLVLFVEWAWSSRMEDRHVQDPDEHRPALAGIVVTARQEYRLTLDRRVGAEARIRMPALFCQRQNSGRTGLDDHYSPVS